MGSVPQSSLFGSPGPEHAGDLFGSHRHPSEFRSICDIAPIGRALLIADCNGRQPDGTNAAKANGGRPWASAAIPYGSVFYVALPRANTTGGQ